MLTASYGGDKLAVSPIGADGLVTAAAIQVLPTGRNAHSILADRTNRFVYSANLGANQVLQFAFDAETGKLTPLDPPAVKPEPGHGPRHLAFSRDNKFLYVLNELSGHVTQYAIDGTKGTLKLMDSVPSVPPELGMKWGQPQAPVGAAPASSAPAPKPDEKPPIWAADLRLTPSYGRLFEHTRKAGVGVVGIRVLAGGALSGSTERHPIASPAPEPIGSAMSYEADVTRARRLMPIVQEGFAATLTEAATRFAISHPAIGTILIGPRMRSPRFKKVLCHPPH